jgi:hypothetical protein
MTDLDFAKYTLDAKLEVLYMQLQQMQQIMTDLQAGVAALVAAKDNLAGRVAALEGSVAASGLTAAEEDAFGAAVIAATGSLSTLTNALDLMAQPPAPPPIP